MKTIFQTFLLFMSAVFLAACSSVPEESKQSVEWENHKSLLAQIEQYQATGKLGYKSPEIKQSLNFIWTHSKDKSQLRLTTFLGQTVLNLEINQKEAKVTDRDGNIFTDSNATHLVYRLTGLVIPVNYMQDWIKGLPTDADSFQLNTETNTLSSLAKQLGTQDWQLNYVSYQTVDRIPLPYSMNLEHSDTSLKIVVSKWKI
ncbi:lipoprotein insertase outer membrane protein LolB [Vibrio sp. JC009]|uniref:lipoprotein insertase outer membrane protein LolB n=1 Tax=Vibrio sp. JC009 TaxID=2912314 RepID=UPI0023AF9108|nr:lipoprotein insertase outer membrane protein LolB [Vibrio sp. JC009]WED22507.1 lipoprotein insertase outer membrane protein LolB [Vibrio sp. JC009]